MRAYRHAHRFASFLFASVVGACSSSSALPDKGDAQPTDDATEVADAPPIDGARPVDDAASPDAGPVGDGGAAVWSAESTGFVASASGGYGPSAPDGSLCVGNSETYRYDVPSRQVTETGCAVGQPVAVAVVLTQSAAGQLAALLSSLRAGGPNPTGCGADAPDEELTILGPGSSQQNYSSDFYSAPGCIEDAGAGPFIAHQALDTLFNDLYRFLAACAPDGGVGAADAGASCVIGDQ